MQKRHADRQLYFNEQSITTQKYVIPFIEKHKPITADSHILEIGCGEGGNIKPFLDLGCQVTGIDIMRKAINGMRKDDAVENILNMFARTKNNREYINMVKKNRII